MFFKLQLFTLNIATAILLIFFLCLGSQNLREKHSLSLGFSSTEAYPSGFLIGVSIALGSLSGNLTSLLLIPSKNKNDLEI